MNRDIIATEPGLKKITNRLVKKMEKQYSELDKAGQAWIRKEWKSTKKEGKEDGVQYFAIGYYKTGLGILPFCGVRKSAKATVKPNEIDNIIKF